MSVPFGPNEQEPFGEDHYELQLSTKLGSEIARIAAETASGLSDSAQKLKITGLVTEEYRHDADFCAKARQIGHAVFSDASLDCVDTRSQAIEFGIVIGRVYSRRLCGATRQFTQMQRQSIDALGLIFHGDPEKPRRDDYEYWIKPLTDSLQDNVSALIRSRAIAPARYIADPNTESLFYDSAAYFGANGLMHLIATKSKMRTAFEELEMKRTARRIDRSLGSQIIPPEV